MKPFSLEQSYYDEETYLGRVLHFYDVINPLRLFTSDAEIAENRKLLDSFKSGTIPASELKTEAMNRKLWSARGTLEAVTHPDTSERLMPCFMAAAFIPANVPISAGMLLSRPTQFNAALWQWANQSYNAGFNYANRPISKGGEEDEGALRSLMTAYVMATGVSCGVALGLNAWLKRAKLSPAMARNLGVAVPYLAVAGAGAFNVFAMRSGEMRTGVPVLHPETDEELGRSQAVAYAALGQCAMSRVVLPAPILLLPPYIIPVLRRMAPGFSATKLGGAVLDISVLVCALSVALPCAIALFPQKGTYPVAGLEPELKEKAEKLNLSNVRFNKGI